MPTTNDIWGADMGVLELILAIFEIILGIIGGIEFGKISLLTGGLCLGLVVALEFVILRDHDFNR